MRFLVILVETIILGKLLIANQKKELTIADCRLTISDLKLD